jgi:hypothetical protein
MWTSSQHALALGCVGETLGLWQMRDGQSNASDPTPAPSTKSHAALLSARRKLGASLTSHERRLGARDGWMRVSREEDCKARSVWLEAGVKIRYQRLLPSLRDSSCEDFPDPIKASVAAQPRVRFGGTVEWAPAPTSRFPPGSLCCSPVARTGEPVFHSQASLDSFSFLHPTIYLSIASPSCHHKSCLSQHPFASRIDTEPNLFVFR